MGTKSSSTAQLYKSAKTLIPGGTQLLSKRPELYAPDRWPAYFQEAKGCEVVDIDGNRYIDMTTNGIGTCLLGFANDAVNQAVCDCIQAGSMCSLNPAAEVKLAQLLIELHPWAEMIRYCRTGGEAMAIAVRIARAATHRDCIAFCGYHGWSDWYLSSNLHGEKLGEHLLSGLEPKGVPQGLAGTAIPFRYNEIDSLKQIMQQHGRNVAAIVMEPLRNQMPNDDFLPQVRQIASENNIPLVFDEISSGWRFHLGGAHLRFEIEPDMAVFAKAISNGFPMAAIMGSSRYMDAAQESFISSTYWTERIGPTAALATIEQMRRIDVPGHVAWIGDQALAIWKDLGANHDVPTVSGGLPQLAHFGFQHPDHLAISTFFTSEMLKHGFLASSQFYPTMAHSVEHLKQFEEAAAIVFAEIQTALKKNDIRQRLNSPVRQTGFQRLT